MSCTSYTIAHGFHCFLYTLFSRVVQRNKITARPEVYLAKYLVTSKAQLWLLREECKKSIVVLCLICTWTSGNCCAQGCTVLFYQGDLGEIHFWFLLSAFSWYRRCTCSYKSSPDLHLILNQISVAVKKVSNLYMKFTRSLQIMAYGQPQLPTEHCYFSPMISGWRLLLCVSAVIPFLLVPVMCKLPVSGFVYAGAEPCSQPKPLPNNTQLLCKLPQLLLSHHGLSPVSHCGHSHRTPLSRSTLRCGVGWLEQPAPPYLPGTAGECSLYLPLLQKQMCQGWPCSGLSASRLTFLPDVLFLLNSKYCRHVGKALALDAQSFQSCSSVVFPR